MDDRELLEMAAKAAGLTYKITEDHVRLLVRGSDNLQRPWNPLDDDGDAFRAANGKGISIIHEHPSQVTARRLLGGEWFTAWVNNPDDYNRAARLAIVHVLAEIGSKTP